MTRRLIRQTRCPSVTTAASGSAPVQPLPGFSHLFKRKLHLLTRQPAHSSWRARGQVPASRFWEGFLERRGLRLGCARLLPAQTQPRKLGPAPPPCAAVSSPGRPPLPPTGECPLRGWQWPRWASWLRGFRHLHRPSFQMSFLQHARPTVHYETCLTLHPTNTLASCVPATQGGGVTSTRPALALHRGRRGTQQRVNTPT